MTDFGTSNNTGLPGYEAMLQLAAEVTAAGQ